jgi:uncharacterized protein involved in exopolysaccharide biosynthesis
MDTINQPNGAHRAEAPPQLRLAPTTRLDPSSPAGQIELAADAGHLLDYLRVLHKRRWTAATAWVLVLATATAYTFTVTPIYEARTRLLIEADNPNIISFTEVIDEQGAKADYYQTQYNILQSRVLARKTIGGLQLWDSPHFGGRSGGWRRLADLVGLGAWWSPAADSNESPSETVEQSRAIDRFLQQLTVSPIRNSRLVDLKYRLSDAELAMRVVNALA